jgi:hypothetical protein
MGNTLPKKISRIKKHKQVIDSHITSVRNSLHTLIFTREKEGEEAIHKKKMLVSLVAFFLVLSLGAILTKEGKAEVATFYPTACLGGWSNPHNAEGIPETPDNTIAYSITNSTALAKDLVADLYCGAFKGEVPTHTMPTKITLAIAWKSLSDDEVAPITGGSFASSSLNILDATSTEGFTLASSTASSTDATADKIRQIDGGKVEQREVSGSTTSARKENIQSQDSLPTVSSTSPQSFLDKVLHVFSLSLFERVYAVEDTVPLGVESIKGETVSTISESDSSTVTPVDVVSSGTTTDLQIIEATTTAKTTESLLINAPVHTEIFEIMYTLDGETWNSLGKVRAEDLAYNTFEIPVTSTSTWDDISNIQIKIKSLVSQDSKPTIFVDGMSLVVEYDKGDPNKVAEKADPKRYSMVVTAALGDIDPVISIDPDQGSAITLTSRKGGSVLIYKDVTGDIVYSSGLGSSPLTVNSYIFDPGTFTLVITSRGDGCNGMTLEACEEDSDVVGTASFTVSPTKDTPTKYVHTE